MNKIDFAAPYNVYNRAAVMLYLKVAQLYTYLKKVVNNMCSFFHSMHITRFI